VLHIGMARAQLLEECLGTVIKDLLHQVHLGVVITVLLMGVELA
jgi:hypothetical protein